MHNVLIITVAKTFSPRWKYLFSGLIVFHVIGICSLHSRDRNLDFIIFHSIHGAFHLDFTLVSCFPKINDVKSWPSAYVQSKSRGIHRKCLKSNCKRMPLMGHHGEWTYCYFIGLSNRDINHDAATHTIRVPRAAYRKWFVALRLAFKI